MKGEKRRVSLRMYFLLIIFFILVGAYILSNFLLAFLDEVFHFSRFLPLTICNIILTLIVGLFLSSLLSRTVLSSITRLSGEMRKVAEGDFSLKLDTESRINEIQDIYSSFNQMTKDLASTETLQTDFISNVSHEFKTPINAIEGYAMLLQDNPQLQGEQGEYINKILFNTKRLSELTSNILLLAKIDNQSFPAKTSFYRLDEQIRQAIVLLEPKWTEKDIYLDVEMEEADFKGNEPLLFHVWLNLIDNAVKFNPPGGSVIIRLKVSGSNVLFTIADNGPGIKEEEQGRIFEKFYQSDSSHVSEGNGLGLALVKKIVDVHKGTIQVENRVEGGCLFTAVLPMTQ